MASASRLALALALAACAPAPITPLPAPSPAPIADAEEQAEASARLVESVPVGTELGSKAIQDTHEAWIGMIEGASRSIDVGQLYAADGPGRDRFDEVVGALQAASMRGVKVRVLVDALFTSSYAASLARLERFAEVRVTEAWKPGIQHCKYLVVDERELYVGSANLDWRSLEHIHELGLRVTSPQLGRTLADLFARDWRLAEGGEPSWGDASWPTVELVRGGSLRLVASPAGALPDPAASELAALVEAFAAAKERAAIQLLDYDAAHRDGRPFTKLDDAIRAAAARGVHVRILLSDWQMKNMEAVKALHQLDNIEVALVTIPRAAQGFIPFARVIHAKYAAFDGRLAWLGSSNWKGDYFEGGRNVGVMIEGSPLVAELEQIFGSVWMSGYAELVDPRARYRPPRIE